MLRLISTTHKFGTQQNAFRFSKTIQDTRSCRFHKSGVTASVKDVNKTIIDVDILEGCEGTVVPAMLDRTKRFQQYKLISTDIFSKCVGGDKSKLFHFTEQELKKLGLFHLKGAIEYSCFYMLTKSSSTLLPTEPVMDTIERITQDKRFTMYVQMLWDELLTEVQKSAAQNETVQRAIRRVMCQIYSQMDSEHGRKTDRVLIDEKDWHDMRSIILLVAICRYCYIPFTFRSVEGTTYPYHKFDDYLTQVGLIEW